MKISEIIIESTEWRNENSLGKKITNNPQTLANFWNWFDDSKIADSKGRPIVMYHGSGSVGSITAFDPTKTGRGTDQLGSGFYFTSDPEGAGAYTDGDSPGIIPVYLSIQNPLVVSEHSITYVELPITTAQIVKILKQAPNIYDIDSTPLGDFIDVWSAGKVTDAMLRKVATQYVESPFMLANDFFSDYPTEFRKAMHSVMGIDGVVHQFDNGAMHVVAWFPNQIKSAIGNRGTWSKDDELISEIANHLK